MNLDLIDLRFCNLLDMDAEDVLALCRLTERDPEEEPKLVVDLSGNRFTPEATLLLADICLLDQVAYMYVPEVGCFGAKKRFSDPQLNACLFDKLIFIHKPQLNFDGWRSVVPEALQHPSTRPIKLSMLLTKNSGHIASSFGPPFKDEWILACTVVIC